MNKVVIVGRLTRDPDLRYPSTNVPVANFTVAVNRPFENQNGERVADFINVIVWRNQAENVKKYVGKGSLVGVEGRIQTRNYDGADGKKVYVTEVVADRVEFLESRNASQARMSSGGGYVPSEPQMNDPEEMPQVQPTTNIEEDDPFANFGNEVEISDDDLPF